MADALEAHRHYSGDGTWDKVHAALLSDPDTTGQIDCAESVDFTVNRAYQYATNLPGVGLIVGA